jgi:valyl-tRNA synthetase
LGTVIILLRALAYTIAAVSLVSNHSILEESETMKESVDEQAFAPRIKASRWEIKREEEQMQLWEKENTYKFNKASKKPLFSIDTPPPTASGNC